jgi:putative ABC transport system permease protein
MRWWHQFLFRFDRIVHWREADQDLEEEIRSHIELEIEDNIDRGMPPEEARRAARVKFGSATLAKEDSRAVWGGLWAEQLWQDLRYGARVLTKSPGFAATAVVSLALGIGATTAVFSIVDTIFLRPLPYPEPDRLVDIHERRLDNPDPHTWELVSTPTFRDWEKQSQSFEEMAEYVDGQFVFNGSDRSEQVLVRHVSEGYFHVLGAHACQGRVLIPDDYAPGQPTRAVLSYPAWQRLFGSNPSIIGSAFKLEGKLISVIGVMSPEYQPLGGDKIDFWIRNWMDKRELRMWFVIGRLKPGISIEKAQAEMDVIEARLARQYPEQKGYGARILPLQVYMYGWRKNQFLAFFGAVVLVLLIACMNVANLLLARGATRGKEMAVRSSLGAKRARLVRQLLTESMLLSVLGAGLGLLLAYAGVRFAVYASPEYAIPRADEISISLRMLGFTVLVTLLTGWLFGLFPALRASKPDLTESLKEGRQRPVVRVGRCRVQSVLVIGQIGLSLLLLIGAGLMIHNVWRVLHASFGFNTDHLAQMSIQLPQFEYMEHIGEGSFARMKPKTALTIQGIEERLRALPGVRAVSVTSSGVFFGCNGRPMSAEGPPRRQDTGPVTCYEPVSPGYFGMLEIPVFKGRVFTDRDSGSSPPIAIISQSVAQRFFPGQDPIGKIINIGIWESDDFERRQVVGVVADIRWHVNGRTLSAVYYPYSQLPAQFHWLYGVNERLLVKFLVRSAADPAALVRAMDRVVPEVARDVLISAAETVDNTRRSTLKMSRYFTWLLVAFAGTALALAAVGVFGVMSYEVARRTHEMGIRMALGANPGDVLRLILRNGILMTSVGLAIGLGSSLALARFLESRLGELGATEVKPTDPATLAVVSLFLALVALLACYIPARRAARMDPTTSLRYE